MDRVAAASEKQVQMEQEKVLALQKMANAFILGELPESQAKADLVSNETELMLLDQRKRKLQLLLELEGLEKKKAKSDDPLDQGE